MQFPCIVCNKEVRPRQHAVACDACERWQHRTCNSGISIERYRQAVHNGDDLSFICSPCSLRIPSRDDSNDDSASHSAESSDHTTDSTESATSSEHHTSSMFEHVTFHVQTSLLSNESTTTNDSTIDNAEPPEPMDTTLSRSFNIPNRVITDQPETHEQSIAEEPLSTTLLEEVPVRYDMYEEGSKRGKPLLVGSDGFRYYIKKKLKNSVLWTCSKRSPTMKCYATVSQKGDDYTRGPNPHQHGPDPSLPTKVKVTSQVKKEAKRHVYQSATDLVNTALRENIDNNQPGRPVPASVARVANRYRSKFRPAEPKDLDFELDTEYLQSQDFLVADIRHGTARHLVFATEEQLKLLSTTKRWFMDGTFKVIGHPFTNGQLESIHGFVTKDGHEKQIPLAFILMSRKRTEDYVKVLTEIRDALDDVVVENFVLDFEQAMWLAVRQVFPGASIKGCVFHFTQAVWRKVRDLGLRPLYMERNSVYTYIRQLMALPFLPANHIEPAFAELSGRANSEPLRRLVAYMETQWLNHAIFDVASWSVFGLTVRTNNDVEGWHHRLNRQAGHQSLSLYRLVPALRNEAELALYELGLVRDGLTTRRRRPASRAIENKVKELWSNYADNELTTSELLRECSRVYGPQCETSEEE